MLTPSKVVAAAAVAALMGTMLMVGPFTTRDDGDPATPASLGDQPIVTLVSGGMSGYFASDSQGSTSSHDWGYTITDALGTWQLEMSDERLSGRSRMRTDYYARSGSEFGPFAFSMYLENDGRSWAGSGVGYMDPIATEGEPGGIQANAVLAGQDGYEGLTAILAMESPDGSFEWEVTGAIQPLGVPPMPGAAPTTFE